MGKDSGIQWTHHTFNSWRGCTKVSAGCSFRRYIDERQAEIRRLRAEVSALRGAVIDALENVPHLGDARPALAEAAGWVKP